METWNDLEGDRVSDLTSDARFPLSPDTVAVVNTWTMPQTSPNVDNFGRRVRGFFRAPTTGDYTFAVASDDNSALMLGQTEDTMAPIARCPAGLAKASTLNTRTRPASTALSRASATAKPTANGRAASQRAAVEWGDGRYVLEPCERA